MTPLAVDDRLALADLVHRYAARVDDRDHAGVAELFCEDGVLATPAPPQHLDPVAEHVGRTAVRRALAGLDGMAATFHAVTGAVFDAEHPDRATGRVACLAHHVTRHDDRPRDLVWAVTYRDDYRRTSDGWLFARRAVHVTFVATQPLHAAVTGAAS